MGRKKDHFIDLSDIKENELDKTATFTDLLSRSEKKERQRRKEDEETKELKDILMNEDEKKELKKALKKKKKEKNIQIEKIETKKEEREMEDEPLVWNKQTEEREVQLIQAYFKDQEAFKLALYQPIRLNFGEKKEVELVRLSHSSQPSKQYAPVKKSAKNYTWTWRSDRLRTPEPIALKQFPPDLRHGGQER